jgi:LmbE family N-acetylglucosaminyl deacetylase
MTEVPRHHPGPATGGDAAGWLVLSPHLDDAALSLGGTIGRLCASGEAVRILTVFAGDEPQPAPTPLGAGMLRGWGFPPGEAMAGRRQEDHEACSALGAGHPVHLSHLEAIHRCDPRTSAPLYPAVPALFGEPAAVEGELVAAIARQLREGVSAGGVVAPLAVGGHVDHRILRAAAEAAFGPNLSYYEDYPYARAGGEAVEPALGGFTGWRHTLVPLAEMDLERKIAAIAAYRSQVPHLFRGRGALARDVTAQARQVGGERLWRRGGAWS